MTIKQAKSLDIVGYLSMAGHEPQKISGNHYWYLSPFRDERTPSFKVNRKLNRWFDFADGKGGNLVDLGTLLHNCSVTVFLQKIDNGKISIQQQIVKSVEKEEQNQIKILSSFTVSSYPLVKYVTARKIAKEIGDKYLSELRYQIGDKSYYA